MSVEDRQELREYEIPIGEYARILWRRRWVVLGIVILSTVIGIAHTAFWVPKTYEAEAKIMPLKTPGAGGLSTLGVSTLPIGLVMGGSPFGRESDRLVNILRSRSLVRRLALELRLIPKFAAKDLQEARSGSLLARIRWGPEDRIALELVNRYPERIPGLPDAPDQSPEDILSLTDEETQRYLDGLDLPRDLRNQATIPEIREAWYRAVSRVLDEIRESIAVQVDRTELTTIRVTAEDPLLAATIANGCIDQLNWFLQTYTLTQARRNREFLEKQYRKVEAQLREAARRLEEFQRNHRIIALPEQASQIVQSAIALEADLETKKVQRDVLAALGASPYSADYRQLTLEIEGISQQLDALRRGSNRIFGTGISQLPALERQYAELLLEKAVREELFKYVAREYESAKIQEAREQIGFEVLDPALPPAEPSGPSFARRGMVALLIGIFLATFVALVAEYRTRRKDQIDPVSADA